MHRLVYACIMLALLAQGAVAESEDHARLVSAIRELEQAVIDSIDLNAKQGADAYAFLAIAADLTPAWRELGRLFLDIANSVIGLVCDLHDFHTSEGGTRALEDPLTFKKILTEVWMSKDPLAFLASEVSFLGLVMSPESYTISFQAISDVEMLAREEYKASNDFSRTSNAAWNELWNPSTQNGLLIPLRNGSRLSRGGRNSATQWENGIRPVRQEIKDSIDNFILSIPDPLPDGYPLDENIAYLNDLTSQIRGGGFRIVRFKSIDDGKFKECHLSLGMVNEDREAASFLYDAWLNDLDVQYTSTFLDTGETICDITSYATGGTIKEISSGLSDLYDIKGIIQVPEEFVNIIDETINPLYALQDHTIKTNIDLIHETSNLWTLSTLTLDYLSKSMENSCASAVLAFDVSPLSLTTGESFEITYMVSGNDGSGLKQVELWRKDETSDWQEIQRNTLAGETGPVSGSFTDSPPAPGKYWYGVHVVDNAGNWNDEQNANTANQPGDWGPAEVEVKGPQPVTLTLYVHDGSADGPLLSGVEVTGQDAAGSSFSAVTNEDGIATITGMPGIWSFSASASNYEINSWSQDITDTCTKHAFLQSAPSDLSSSALAAAPVADAFDYPVGTPRTLGGTGYVTQTNDRDSWYNAQDWADYNSDYGGYHPGEDWNDERGGSSDVGAPVYAIANGVVTAITSNVAGNGITINHKLTNGELIYSVYIHIDVQPGLNVGSVVRLGDQIGSIANIAKPHLHFEIRTQPVDPKDWYPNDQGGNGYYASSERLNADGFTVDPSEFIDSHRGEVSTTDVVGIDVSDHQGSIDWSQVAGAGYSFAFVKASEGEGWTGDSKARQQNFEANMQGASSAGMLGGAYHFARPDLGNSAVDEARWFVNVTGGYIKPGYLRPVLDIEVGADTLGGPALSSWVGEWMETVTSETGVEPLIYTSADYAGNYLASYLSQYDLWVAHWTYDTGQNPRTGIWDGWAFWQYSDKGQIPGIAGDVDLDIFNGSKSELSDFVISMKSSDMIIDADIVDPVYWPKGAYLLGDQVNMIYAIKNNGTVAHDFYMGCSVEGPDRDRQDIPYKLVKNLEPNETRIERLVWTVPESASEGDYNITIAVWKDKNGTDGTLIGELDRETRCSIFVVGVIRNSTIVLFDASGSMAENNKIGNAKEFVKDYLTYNVDENDEVALIVFYDCYRIILEQPFTKNRTAVESKIDLINPEAYTPLYNAVQVAKCYMEEESKGAHREILLLTDGIETCGGQEVSRYDPELRIVIFGGA